MKNIQQQDSKEQIQCSPTMYFHFKYLSILDRTESQGDSPIQTFRHTIVRHEIGIFFLKEIHQSKHPDIQP